MAQGHSQPNPAVVLPNAFELVLAEIKAKPHVAVILPSALPQPISGAKYATLQSASNTEYAISLYYELGIGDAGFAAFFAANGRPDYWPKDIPKVRKVKLSQDLVGYFSKVGCGGSCAPANLEWEEDHVLYQIQLRLSPHLSEKDQQGKMISVANSAILAGPR